MLYRVSDAKGTKDRIYSVEKINYITRDNNKIHVFYESWSNELTAGSSEEAEEFMGSLHKLLNNKEIFRRLLDIFI